MDCEQDTQEIVPAILGEVGDRTDVPETGARNEQVEPSECVESRLDAPPVPSTVVRSPAYGIRRPSISGSRSTDSTECPFSTNLSAIALPIPLAVPEPCHDSSVGIALQQLPPDSCREQSQELQESFGGVHLDTQSQESSGQLLSGISRTVSEAVYCGTEQIGA